jgi:subtilisin family serine protease
MKSNTARLAVRRAASQIIETLEARRLMAATPASVSDRIDSHLLDAVIAYQRRDAVLAGNIDRRVRFDKSGAVEAYIRIDGRVTELADRLRAAGVDIEASNDDMQVVQGWIGRDALERVAAIDGVTRLEIPDYAITNVTSAGDAALNADDVRSKFALNGIDGTGVKIGVISDGVNHKANVGAELPSVTVNPSIPGSGDEGTAMLEIVHDLAPGADLYFSGPNTSVQMVNSINWLVGQGCKVIVDDLGFLGESYFTDTAVAQAAQNAVDSGAVYVTSAGNFGNGHYQGNYVQGQSAFNGGLLHKFGGLGQEVNKVTIPNGASFRAFLQWSDAPGTSANNYDLYLYENDDDDFGELDHSTTVQNGSNDYPFEYVTYTNNTGSAVSAELWVLRKNGAATRELELFTIGNFAPLQFNTGSDMLFGQEAVVDVMSVAAAPAASPSNIESFSSRGGSTVYSNFTTQTKSPVRQTLDGTAVDGVNTAVGAAGFFSNPFYGTSAAAPHAAAIAALVRQANPLLTPSQVLQAMASTAVDISTAGYDINSGAGRYDALAAVYSVYTPPAPDLAAASDTGVSSIDNITNDNTPTFTGTVPLGSQVRLLIDGVSTVIAGLAPATGSYSVTVPAGLSNGVHTATLQVSGPNGLNAPGASLISTSLPFTVDTIAPTVTVPLAFAYNSFQQNLSITFSENLSASFTPAALKVNSTATGDVPNANKLLAAIGNNITMTFPAYPYGALPNGNYTAMFAAGAPTDAAGNAVAGLAPYSFFSLAGDANRDAKVEFADLVILSQNYDTTGRTFSEGNFNYDLAGKVDFDDLVILAQNYGIELPSPISALVTVPSTATKAKKREPSSIFA